MKKAFTLAGLTTGFVLGGSLAASAAVLDFTDNATFDTISGGTATGTIGYTSWTMTSSGPDLNISEGGPGPTGILLGQNDGVGVDDDEISNDVPWAETGYEPSEWVFLQFSRVVEITSAFFLDLFIADDESSFETANIWSPESGAFPGDVITFNAMVPFSDGVGYGAFETSITGSSFYFFAGDTNDEHGFGDFALAALDIAPIPLPAGVLLLGTALAGLGLSRRRKS